MKKILFDYNRLNQTDKKIYDAMSKYEKERYESTWVQIETLKARQIQQKHASKERAARERKLLAEKERKERTHRLIERGAILEAYIKDPQDFSNEEIKEIVRRCIHSKYGVRLIEEIRSRNLDNSEIESIEGEAY